VNVCTSCGLNVRFQEYASGFHNYNNHTLLSLKLRNYLLKGIKVGKYVRLHFDITCNYIFCIKTVC